MNDAAVLTIYVTSIEAAPRSTVAVGVGQLEDGRWCTFAGATRQMLDLAAALEAGGTRIPAAVPSWAILHATPPMPEETRP